MGVINESSGWYRRKLTPTLLPYCEQYRDIYDGLQGLSEPWYVSKAEFMDGEHPAASFIWLNSVVVIALGAIRESAARRHHRQRHGVTELRSICVNFHAKFPESRPASIDGHGRCAMGTREQWLHAAFEAYSMFS